MEGPALLSGDSLRWIDPRNWPWFVYVWVAFSLVGLVKPGWRWLRRRIGATWPSTQGHIESAEVRERKRFFLSTSPRGSSPVYEAEVVYTYSVAGSLHAGMYETEFGAEGEAREFVRDLKGKPVEVHYTPNGPSRSVVLENSIKALLETRPPLPAAKLVTSHAESVPEWLKPYLWIFVAISAVGLAVSLWVHLGAVIGRRVVPDAYFWILHVGIFVVWFLAVLVGKRLVSNVNRRDFWKVALRGSPEWMRYMVYCFLGYAFLNFLFCVMKTPSGRFVGGPSAIVWRGFSGHWMAFYSAALAILYSATQLEDSGH